MITTVDKESSVPEALDFKSGNKKDLITVKFLHRGYGRGKSIDNLLRLFPGQNPQWGMCRFEFDHDCDEYDWLVVYHDLPSSSGVFSEEKLACPREKTLLLTGEPSSITVFGKDYLKQFGHILTFQEPWAIPHEHVIFRHPGLTWFYGFSQNGSNHITWDTMAKTSPLKKTKLLSTVCSQRTGKITLHSKRVEFTKKLKKDLSFMDIFGHGVNPMNDKAEALDDYKYHITIENHVYPHHLTEKLPDAFLGFTLPFYHGAPNASEYFPKESFIPIDINEYQRSKDIISYHINNNEYEDRLPYIIEARRRVMEEQNLFAILSTNISRRNKSIKNPTMNRVIRNRKTMRIKNPAACVRSLTEKAVIKTVHGVINFSNAIPFKMPNKNNTLKYQEYRN